jgi:hypothetical protein
VRWHAFHIHYHEDNHDALVLHGVRPLLRALSGTAAFYTRHWRQGPHVRVHVKGDAATVRPVVHDVIGEFLRARPSKTILDAEEHLAMHRRLAELEGDPGPLLPWPADNSIVEAPYERRLDGDAAVLLEEFYVETTEHALRTTERFANGAQRLGAGFDLMIATAHALSGIGIEDGFLSFRSHAEGFLSLQAEGAELRASWDEHRRRHRRSLEHRLRAVLAGLDSGRDAHVAEWMDVMVPYGQRVARLVADGRLLAEPVADDGRFAGPSLFHQRMHANEAWAEIRSAPWFKRYRWLLNCTYLQLTRLGLKPVERYLLCHLAAGAVEDVFGVSAVDLIERPVEQIALLRSPTGVSRWDATN